MFVHLQKKSGVVKSQEKKERWKEKKAAKRQKREDEESAVVPAVAAVTEVAAAVQQEEEEENVQPAVDPLENGFLHHAQREQERMTERLLKKTYSKKNKTVSGRLHHFVPISRHSEVCFLWKTSSCCWVCFSFLGERR